MFKETTSTIKINSLRKRIRAVSGGTSASKTISIIIWLIAYAQTVEGELVSIVSESLPHLKRGAIRDFLNIMQDHRYFDDARWNKTDFTYTFETGSKIEFFSVDQPSKVRGPRRDVLFINEANNITHETYIQLEIRTSKIIWLDWNPVSEFWWYTEVSPNIDHDFLTLTYKDNEALGSFVVKALEVHKHNKAFWRVYGLGLLGEAEGRIYKGWEIIEKLPREARLERFGVDFGYTNDPTAIVAIYKYNDSYIIDEVVYRKGLSNKEIADILGNTGATLVIADSAEPKSIDEIKSYDVNILPAQKGKGSVSQGIQYVQGQAISVTKHSLNVIKEYRNYLWITDRDGKIVNEPQHVWSHSMDAIRYGLDSFRKPITYKVPDLEELSRMGVKTPYGGIDWD